MVYASLISCAGDDITSKYYSVKTAVKEWKVSNKPRQNKLCLLLVHNTSFKVYADILDYVTIFYYFLP